MTAGVTKPVSSSSSWPVKMKLFALERRGRAHSPGIVEDRLPRAPAGPVELTVERLISTPLKRGARFVEGGPKIATAGGLTSGIDMALRVVEPYFGRSVAETTARYMEHDSKAWQV